MFGTKSFSALYAKPSSWLKPMLEFEFLTSAGVILYFQCYQKNLRLMLNCYKPMTKGINEPLRELKRQLIEEGLLTFHDTEYKNVFGKDEENFRVSLYHGRDDTYFWEMVMTVMDRERAGRVNDLFVSCHVPLDRLADFRMDSRWEKLVTKERPHGNSLNEKFLLTALEKKDSQGRSGYKLALINNSRVPFLKVSEKTDAVKVSEDKRARPREPENLPRRKATAVKSRSLLELDGFYLPEDFEYPRTITLAVTPPYLPNRLPFGCRKDFPWGYTAPRRPSSRSPSRFVCPSRNMETGTSSTVMVLPSRRGGENPGAYSRSWNPGQDGPDDASKIDAPREADEREHCDHRALSRPGPGDCRFQ